MTLLSPSCPMAKQHGPALVLPESEARERKSFLELTEHDETLLRDLHEKLNGEGSELAEAFYEHLLKYPHLGSLLDQPATLGRLKKSQAAYFHTLTAGSYGPSYVQERVDIGVIHQRIGLDPKWYIGAYRKYLSHLFPLLHRVYADQPGTMLATYDALIKIVSFDMGLALDAYFEADKREIIRHKEYAEQLITALPEGLAVVDETMAIR